MKTFYYKTWIPFSTYDTDFEVDMIDDTDEEEPAQPPKLIWQEGKARCLKCKTVLTTGIECPECGSKEIQPIEPMIFNDWETADKMATQYWENLLKKEQVSDTEGDI
jgi:hypothetical protein